MKKALDKWIGGITFNSKKISNLRYADDTTYIASFEKELIDLFRKIKNAVKQWACRSTKTKPKQ